MMKKRNIKTLILASLLGLIPCTAFAQGTGNDAERKKLSDLYHAMEGEILFYGKVVDQFTNSVVNARVDVSVPVVNLLGQMSYARKALLTDKNGNFEVSSKNYGVSKLVGQYLYVERIKMEGYEGDGVHGVDHSFSFSTDNSQRFRADVSKPVIFQLRKTGLPTFLFQNDLVIGVETTATGWTNGYDFIKQHHFQDTHRLAFNGESVFPDIQLKATFSTNAATWTVLLLPGNTNGGIIASEQMLYEAPETGYQPEYVFTPEDYPKPVKMSHLYLKSREPAIYTRIDIRSIHANKEFFQLSGDTVTNPYGDRNLERAADLPFKVSQQLEDEAKAAFRADKRPTPPDLPKLVKEAKAKSGKNQNQ
jgi:hypothetical protein